MFMAMPECTLSRGPQDVEVYIRIRYRRKAIAVCLFQLTYLYTYIYVVYLVYISGAWLAHDLIKAKSRKTKKKQKYFLISFIKFDLSADLMADYIVSHLQPNRHIDWGEQRDAMPMVL